ncbi:glycosyltransferase family 2 protein [Pseudobacteriovorax antillogorgiicola]|uniref:Glycosyltransferase involved in cell wall bisynthesis n=2 Tax=Pseudobacteriovorax antillogorgiicola TaxID=1513793 RepID=A0A1Y6CMV7_9BACT|nr:glycosyltransferase [Pseudobacteriovorax antillogorgiicola]TCS45221.1 glycosyltransferase involved in cell wall biosynthesis [Pseudobacteriovorax antillogorgiicola]SMF75411.1 Glycosyltransferase involved in cell wall bisynthesis [Pseudobacteriovorax antillogorgiicola]
MSHFSIIIPTFNHGYCLPRAIKSVLNQTFQDFEIVIVNNYSSDNTVAVVETFKDSRIKLLNFRNNGVIAASRNHGIKNSSGKFVAFLDSDDYWYPNKLSALLNYCNEYDFIYHAMDHNSNSGRLGKIMPRKLGKRPYIDLLEYGNCIANSSVVMRRDLLVDLRYLNEDPKLFAIEDFDLWLRVARSGAKILAIKEALGVYWTDSNNISHTTESDFNKINYLYKLHEPYLNSFEKKFIRGSLAYKQARCDSELDQLDIMSKYLLSLIFSRNLKIKCKSALGIAFGWYWRRHQKPSMQ